MATPEQIARLHAAVPAAQAAQRKWGVPAPVTLAQWILESSWGTSKLATSANNFFGIKAAAHAAPETYVEFQTGEYENGRLVLVPALFARYESEAESFEAHARLLATAARYKRAMLAVAWPRVFALDLATCGYSTAPQYGRVLIDLMNEYNLLPFSQLPPPLPPAAQEAA